MKKVYYSTSLFKAKGRGEIYNNHNEKILEFENTKVIALDRDIDSEKSANQLKEKFSDRFIFKKFSCRIKW